MVTPAIWIEEPGYAQSYARGVSVGIEDGYRGKGPSERSLSPAFHRGWRAGYQAARKATKR